MTDPEIIYVVLACCLLVVLAYITGRAASLGWHRSKLEYFRKVWKHMNGEENGKG